MPESECGRHFGNAGAKASHEAHCDECKQAESKPPQPKPGEPDPKEAQPAATQSRRPEQERTEPPVEQETAPQVAQSESEGPGTALASAEEMMQMGMVAGDVADSLTSNDPEERAAATGQAMQAAGMGIAQLGQKYAQKKMEGARRSKERAGETLDKAESYACCPDCERQIMDLPEPGVEFACPHCGVLLES